MAQRNYEAAPAESGKRRWLGMFLGGLCIVAACVAIKLVSGNRPADAQSGKATVMQAVAPAPEKGSAVSNKATGAKAAKSGGASSERSGGAPPDENAKSQLKVVAQVNGVPVTREQLGQDCLIHYGSEVLEALVNKHLIVEACKQRNITVSRAEVDAEIERMAQRFNLPVDQWMKLLKQERGITALQYASDVVWPTLALRKLAGDRLKVTPAELREAFDAHYGPSVRCRVISLRDRKTAEKVRALAVADPGSFGDLAKQYSEDASASVKGVSPPIRRGGNFPMIEDAAFAMKDGEVSKIIEAGGQFVILLRESEIPGAASVAYNRVAPQLEEVVREKKLRKVSAEVFQQLQAETKVENVYNDPAKSQRMPGVAAVINGRPLSIKDLTEQCIERYGETVLDGMVNRMLLEQACKKRNIAISDADLEEEVARQAALMLPLLKNGQPNVKGWLTMVTEQQKVSQKVYYRDVVWPAVALRKLVGDDVKVTEDDIAKGFEANFGPRVRCRAIVMNNARRAQEVWDLARRKLTVENFGKLAEQYSIEPGSQALQGEVPPIKKHGGQPLLEKEAFALQPGELSGIIQVDGKFIILFCEGYTEPVKVELDQVREEIVKDLFEKKLQIAMGQYFERIQDTATVDNYLAGTSRSPTKKSGAPDVSSLPDVKAELPSLKQLSGSQIRRPALPKGADID